MYLYVLYMYMDGLYVRIVSIWFPISTRAVLDSGTSSHSHFPFSPIQTSLTHINLSAML